MDRDRFQQLHPHFFMVRMRCFQGVFRTFLHFQKSAQSAKSPSPRMPDNWGCSAPARARRSSGTSPVRARGVFGWRRSCDHAARVLAVLLVYGFRGSSDSDQCRGSCCMQSVQGLVDVLVNRSDKFQQFTFVVRALCRKPSSFHRCSSWAFIRQNAGSTVDTWFCVSPGCF